MHASHRHQELERGRSRTPKPTPIALGSHTPHRYHHHHGPHTQVPSKAPLHHRQTAYRAPCRPPPPKGRSPDRSEPGALEDAIHEAHARGDLRQCLQWVLELQGIYLDWDDPRLDTVTEDDLCFAESAGMGPNATPEERARAEKEWAMRKAEEDEARRVWELTATEEEKKVSRRLRAQLEAEQRKRDARAQYFKAPRQDKMAAISRQRPSHSVKPVLSCSLASTDTVQPVIRRPPPSRNELLFPVDEAELSAVRAMWREQRRKGLALIETLVRPPAKTSSEKLDTANPCVEGPRSDCSNPSDTNTASSSASTSTASSASAPSELFSSILTTTSVATSISTVTQLSSPCSPSKLSSSLTSQDTKPPPAQPMRRFIPVPSSECPLHRHAASVALRGTLEEDCSRRSHAHRRTQSSPHNSERDAPRRTRSSSPHGWLRRGGRAVEGFVDLVSKLPTSYLPTSEFEDFPKRTMSCPPAPRIRPPVPSSSSETFICLLPLKRPSYPPVIPPIPTLPRSPYRPLTQPLKPKRRMRLVPNPQFLRLKALKNLVSWGLVPVSQAEYDAIIHIERIHEAEATPGRSDVDRCGHMFSAKEVLLRVTVDGSGKSALPVEAASAIDETRTIAALWSWWPIRL